MKKSEIFYTIVIKTNRGTWSESGPIENLEYTKEWIKITKDYALNFVYPGSEFVSSQLYRGETNFFPIEIKE